MDIVFAFGMFGLILFITLVVHEAAHALVMMWFGMPIEKIIIGIPSLITIRTSRFPIGLGPVLVIAGVQPGASFNEFDWKKRFMAVLDGPAVSILFGVILIKFAEYMAHGVNFSDSLEAIKAHQDPCDVSASSLITMLRTFGGAAFFWYLGTINILIGKFNAYPIPPLDGGRMVFLLLEGVFGPRVRKLANIVTLFVVLGYIGYSFYSVGAGIWESVENNRSGTVEVDPCD